jgi:CPA2 family monovalent cation:H+ antiporter-2
MSGTAIDVAALKDTLVVLGTAGVVVPLMRRLRVGSVFGFLVAGAVLGPYGLGQAVVELPWISWVTVEKRDEIAGIADFGVVFLLFVIGLELSIARLSMMKRLVFGLGGVQVLVSAALVTLAAVEFGERPEAALVLGACLALSSTAVVVEILAEQRRLATVTGRTAFAVLLFQDLAVVPILFMVETIGGAGSDGSIWLGLLTAIGQGAAAVAVIAVIGRKALRPLFRLVAETRSTELFTAAVLFVAIATGVATEVAGLSMALGAFIAGLLLAETEYRRAIEAVIEPFKGLLLGVFFFSVGMSVDLAFVVAHLGAVLGGTLALIVTKTVVTAVAARLFGVPPSHAVKTGLLIGAGGEFAFIVVGLAAGYGIVAATTSAYVLAVVSLSMATIPALDLIGRRLSKEIERRVPVDPAAAVPPPGDGLRRAIVVGHGRVGALVGDMLSAHDLPHLVVDRDPATVVAARAAGRPVFFGDATNPLFLISCGIAEASAVIVTVDGSAVVDAIVEAVRLIRKDIVLVVRARDAAHARRLYRKGVTDAVPETIEASLQLSEAALVGLGVAMGPVIASIHERRDLFRRELSSAAEQSPNASPIARRGGLARRRPGGGQKGV